MQRFFNSSLGINLWTGFIADRWVPHIKRHNLFLRSCGQDLELLSNWQSPQRVSQVPRVSSGLTAFSRIRLLDLKSFFSSLSSFVWEETNASHKKGNQYVNNSHNINSNDNNNNNIKIILEEELAEEISIDRDFDDSASLEKRWQTNAWRW